MSIGFELWKHSCSARRGQSCGSTEISLRAPWDQSQSPISCRPDAGRRASRTQSTASRAARLSWRNAIRSRSGGDQQSIPGGSHALANPIAFPDRCSAARHNPGGLGAIADQLSMVCQVLRQLDVRYDLLLLHELSTVYRAIYLTPPSPTCCGCPEKQCPQGYKSAADKTYTAGGYGFLSKRPCLRRPNTRIPAATEARTNTACMLRRRRSVAPIPSMFADNPLSRPHAICRGWWRQVNSQNPE